MKKPLLSILMITYNHESYIEQAIKGVFSQKVNFPVEFVISNDCSTDKTHQKIEEILKDSPENFTIKYYNHTENLGMMENFIFSLKQCQGKYIALCEGDDYWIDNNKLQKQVNFLEKNSDFSLCFSNAKILQENNAENYNKMTIVENRKYQDTELLGKWLIPTASTLFINSFTTEDFTILSNPNILFGDIFLFLILANKGNIKGMENYMTVYRINSESVTNQKKSIIYYEKLFQHLLYLSTIFGGKYKPLLKLGIHNQGYKLFRFYLLKCNIKFINYLSFFLKRFL